jgi:hypothetical protein
MHALDRSRDAIFVERLHAKSKAGGLAWTQTEHEGRYQVQIGEFIVEIGEGGGDEDHADPEILICRPDGRALEILTPALLPRAVNADGVSLRQAFVETFEIARRIALGLDQVMDSLIDNLL